MELFDLSDKTERVILVGVQENDGDDTEESLQELAELAKQEQYGTLEDELNEKYTEQTKLLENRESERYPASSITLYAKWDKIWE